MRFFTLLLVLFTSFATPAIAQESGNMLEALGAVSAQSMYNTYLAIGAVADNYASEGYDAETVTTLMDEQIGLLSKVNGYYKGLLSGTTLSNADDRTFIRNVQKTNEKLALMASTLKAYVNGTGEADAFQDARTATWTDISKLLGIE